jgi:hypothetical protein
LDDIEGLDHTPPARVSKLLREIAVTKQALYPVRQSDRVRRRRQQSGPRNHQFAGSTGRRGHNRYAVTHGLDERHGDTFMESVAQVDAWQNDCGHRRILINPQKLAVRYSAQELDRTRKPECFAERFQPCSKFALPRQPQLSLQAAAPGCAMPRTGSGVP